MNDESISTEHKKLERLLTENLELAQENNKLLHKMKRNSTIGLLLQITWYAILVGVPVILYWYLLEPVLSEDNAIIDVYNQVYNPQGGSN